MLGHANLLRVSSKKNNTNLDIAVVSTDVAPPLKHGPELVALIDAMTNNTSEPPTAERNALLAAAGPEATDRAIGVCATFQMMNRLLDGVGAPVAELLHPVAATLGYDPATLPR